MLQAPERTVLPWIWFSCWKSDFLFSGAEEALRPGYLQRRIECVRLLNENVGARTAVEYVVARTANQDVVAISAQEDVVPCAAD